ncbi:MAG TPA: hypothetical protein VMS93_01910 [Candidatus Saccharimonadales bacterium]|nr:hypothetical protein [Candidatus Saccharimonadales bacterium]
MKCAAAALLLLICGLLLAGCGDTTSPADQPFPNQLTLGTGANGFNLTGQTTSFTRVGGTVTIYWRLQSQEDMAGSTVEIRVDQLTGGSYAPYDSIFTPNPQNYGHIMVASFPWTAAGSFRGTGILVNSGSVVASQAFTVQ